MYQVNNVSLLAVAAGTLSFQIFFDVVCQISSTLADCAAYGQAEYNDCSCQNNEVNCYGTVFVVTEVFDKVKHFIPSSGYCRFCFVPRRHQFDWYANANAVLDADI
ncbi:hypothetical protein RCCS2_05429 [Roseobacter sp. CCS2]|nr:hypothetical protein RCCS2_05429 [Roseobacter sp. CCS2]